MICNKRLIRPKDCERMLNYNGFYYYRQDGMNIIFKDDIGREISIHRGKIDYITWHNIIKENDLVEPKRAFR